MYAYLIGAIESVFFTVNHPCFCLPSIFKVWLIKILVFVRNTIYKRETEIVNQFASVNPVLPIEHQGVAYVLHVPQIFTTERLPLYCVKSVGRVEGNIHAKVELPKHVVLVNHTIMSVDLSACIKLNQALHICFTLHLKPTCLSEASTCTLLTKQYEKPKWINRFHGYALASDDRCKVQKSDRARPARSIDTSNGYVFVLFFNCFWSTILS